MKKNLPSFQIRISEDTTIISKLHYGIKPDVSIANKAQLLYSDVLRLFLVLHNLFQVYAKVFGKYENKAFITCFSETLHPRSRGTVRLQSADPYDPPLIHPNYLDHPNDAKDLVEGN